MAVLFRAISAEVLKMKRTLALLVALGLPAVMIVINLVLFLRRTAFADGDNAWDLFVGNNLVLWGMLMQTLYVTLETALLAGLEHNQQGWKHLAALPVPRAAVYAAKQIVAMAMVALSMGVIILGSWATGTLAQMLNLNPRAVFVGPFPWATLLQVAALSYLLSLLIIAIHHWVATRFANFALASSVGIVATVVSIFILNDDELMRIFPWTLPMTPMVQMVQGHAADLTVPMAIALIGALLVSVIGGWNVVRHDVL